ncbi:MAG TPA: PrsW family glutamic-type intramembrane protease [Anaerolineales bacterium]|nr:PrsW family glutamic-type intramembrane protease [Anaerolineales bacterium]
MLERVETPTDTKPDHGRDILIFIYNLGGILTFLASAVYQAVRGGRVGASSTPPDPLSTPLGVIGLTFCAGLLLPGLLSSLRRLKGRDLPPAKLPGIKFREVVGLIVLWLVSVTLASLLIHLSDFGWIQAAPFYLLGIGVPVYGLAWIATGGLPAGAWRRLWTAFGLGMGGSALAAILAESLALRAGLALGRLAAATHPAVQAIVDQVKYLLDNLRDTEALMNGQAAHPITNPWVFLALLAFVAGVAPLVEEAVKPVAIWLAGKRLRSPAEGFALGALGGAGFALLEGLLVTGESTRAFGIGLTLRAASSLIHITGSGLVGWGIASALLEKRRRRLAWSYLAAVTLHGSWNGGALLALFGSFRFVARPDSPNLLGAGAILLGMSLLGLLFLTAMILLPVLNYRLRPAPAQHNDIIAPPNQTNKE